jgi:hypothetical protein
LIIQENAISTTWVSFRGLQTDCKAFHWSSCGKAPDDYKVFHEVKIQYIQLKNGVNPKYLGFFLMRDVHRKSVIQQEKAYVCSNG